MSHNYELINGELAHYHGLTNKESEKISGGNCRTTDYLTAATN